MSLENTLSPTLEAVSNRLFMDKGFSLSDHGNQERQVATSSISESSRLSQLRALYIKRLKAMMPYMENKEAKTRAKTTIKNLQLQEVQL